LSSTSGALALVTDFNRRPRLLFASQRDVFETAANHSSFAVRDLFERFLPEERRAKRLGATFDVAALLAIKGDAAKGRKNFFQEGSTACHQCHRVNGQGRDFGPDLTHNAQQYNRAPLLAHIPNPEN